MKDLLEFMVKNIVSKPEEVEIEEKTDSENVLELSLKVSHEDMGLVIGKGGKVIKAIRQLIRTKAILENKRVNLVLVENQA